MSVNSDSQAYCLSYFTCRKFGTTECPFVGIGITPNSQTYEGCRVFEYKYYQPEIEKFSVSLTREVGYE
jgi:hypothetical protein